MYNYMSLSVMLRRISEANCRRKMHISPNERSPPNERFSCRMNDFWRELSAECTNFIAEWTNFFAEWTNFKPNARSVFSECGRRMNELHFFFKSVIINQPHSVFSAAEWTIFGSTGDQGFGWRDQGFGRAELHDLFGSFLRRFCHSIFAFIFVFSL